MNLAYFTGIGFQAACVLRLIVSAACGFAIGFERKNRLKEAGMRTHMIVAIGAGMYSLGLAGTALILIIQYWMHNSNWWNIPDVCSVTVRLNEEKGSVGEVMQTIQTTGAQPVDVAVTHKKNGLVKLDIRVRLPVGVQQYQVIEALEKDSSVAEVED